MLYIERDLLRIYNDLKNERDKKIILQAYVVINEYKKLREFIADEKELLKKQEEEIKDVNKESIEFTAGYAYLNKILYKMMKNIN